jgi:putative acetyltransferase
MPAAVSLYHNNGYVIIPNYGQYAGVENSCCFEKKLEFTTLVQTEASG